MTHRERSLSPHSLTKLSADAMTPSPELSAAGIAATAVATTKTSPKHLMLMPKDSIEPVLSPKESVSRQTNLSRLWWWWGLYGVLWGPHAAAQGGTRDVWPVWCFSFLVTHRQESLYWLGRPPETTCYNHTVSKSRPQSHASPNCFDRRWFSTEFRFLYWKQYRISIGRYQNCSCMFERIETFIDGRFFSVVSRKNKALDQWSLALPK